MMAGIREKNHNLRGSSEYNSWRGMKERCLNRNNISYHIYGGRGITICDRWLDFINFYEDMGPKPTNKHSLDRINSNGNYEPSNCRWATITTQNNNQNIRRDAIKVWINGKEEVLSRYCRANKLNYRLIRERYLLFKWSIEDVISKPKQTGLKKARWKG